MTATTLEKPPTLVLPPGVQVERPTTPGLYPDIPESVYHSGPEISSTAVKKLLHCPAEFHHQRTHPESVDHKKALDLGSLAHRLVLGEGPPIRVIDATDMRTKKAQDIRDTAHAAGEIPVMRHQLLAASKMRAKVLRHPTIGPWFQNGVAENSAYTVDPDTWLPLRARFDFLSEEDGRAVITDLKTIHSDPHPWNIGKAIHDFGYHISAAFYLRVARLVDLPDPLFRLVFVSKEAPHEVRGVILGEEELEIGDQQVDRALAVWQRCTAEDNWPCLHPDVIQARLPAYAYYPTHN